MGMIYKRGKVWWVKYYKNGKSFRESSNSTKKMVAKKFLDRREGEIAQGKVPGVQFEKTSFEELAEDFLRDYRINKRKSLVRAERSVNHLNKFFEGSKATQITTPRINIYIESRLDRGAAHATINRELSALKRMLNIGAQQTPPKVDRVPHIKMLKENNVREGFFEHNEFLAVRNHLPDHLKPVATFGYTSGWRLDEILSLPWGQVDRHNGCARLETGDTKNDDARTIYFDAELEAMFNELWQKRRLTQNFSKYVFLNAKGTNRMYRFDKAWKKACGKAGIDRLFHDFRRTAVRNMVRSGIPEGVAMQITGHKTRSVFERYNIVNDDDLKKAAKSQEEYLAKQEKSATGTISGTILQIQRKRD